MAVYFNGTVTTEFDGELNVCGFQYVLLNEASLKITFDGTSYNCSKVDAFGCHFYGGFTEEGPDFTTYPFAIQCNPDVEANNIFTANGGSFTLKIETVSFINRVVFGEDVLIDLSSDTVASADDIANGKVGHLRDGSVVTGTGSGGGITPTGNIDITHSGVTDVTNYATATVPSATISAQTITPTGEDFEIGISNSGLMTADIRMLSILSPITANGFAETTDTVSVNISSQATSQLPTQAAKTVTPTTSSQTAVAANRYTTGAVTVAAMPSGTAGTPTASKGAVNNHAITVTPSVTNTTGYITGGTKTGTGVSVSASELVSGSQTITENSTVDVTNLSEVVVNVSGGGGGIQVGTKAATLASASSSISFTGLSGNPTSFAVTSSADQTTGGDKVIGVVYDGTDIHGQTITTQIEYETGFSKSYSSGTLTITATNAQFQANEYKLVYTYGGSTSDVKTADVQVGSGATSITFNVTGRPLYWSCIFKSTFSTSSGYQRVVGVVNDGTNTYGHAMDSQANAQTSWSYSYSGGSLTITSQGTNQGGYFHQPGYYQLTYVVDDSAPSYQTKTVTPTTSQQTVTADNGYDALSQVTVNAIPSQYVVPSGTLSITSNGTQDVTNYASVNVNVSGGGGSSKNAQTVQNSSTRINTTSYSKACGDLTVSKTGTYDVYWTCYRTSTSGTWGTQLYIDGSEYGSASTTFSSYYQTVHLTNVSLTANEKLSVYARARGTQYYAYVGQLTIIES